MLKRFLQQIINIGTEKQLTDKYLIIRIRAMNYTAFVGIIVCIFTTVAGGLIHNNGFLFIGSIVITLLSVSLYLTSLDKPELGWHLLFTIPILGFTILPLFFPTSPTLMVFYIIFQIFILSIFRNIKILLYYFAFYSINIFSFTIFLFYINPQHINTSISSNLINISAGIIFTYLTLKFYATNRLATEQTLRLEEDKFKTIFEHNPVGILITKIGQPNETLANKSLLNDFGYDKSYANKITVGKVVHPEDLHLHQIPLKKVIDGEIESFKIDRRYIHKEGHIIWGTLIGSVVKDKSDKVIYTVGMFTNITEQKLQEEKINRLIEALKEANSKLEDKINQRTEDLNIANEELQRSNQDLEQFAYAASHDLKEPLRMIGSFIQILEKKYRDQIDDKGKEYIKFTVNGVNRMSNLINSLLQYSRVGRKESKLKIAKINNLIELKLLDLRVLIQERNAQVNILELPEIIVCEPVQIGLVFYNLINNGLKFNTTENPILNIKGIARENDYLFSIQDNGIGIDSKFKEQIFEIFKRLHSREKYEGTGIGLALCRKIIQRHEGDIWFESEIDKGTTFYFTIKKGLVSSE